MTAYDIKFAKRFAQVAQATAEGGLADVEGRRVVLYLSRLSIELAIKAFLENAGVAISKIRPLSHKLTALLKEVDKCQVKSEPFSDVCDWVSAARLRAITIEFHGIHISVGSVIDAEAVGASVYPNEIRYGQAPDDFPPEVVLLAAMAVCEWVEKHWGFARRH